MIRSPTTFILGAGASVPYDFPSGPELCKAIKNELKPPSRGGLPDRLMAAGFNYRESEEFYRELAATAADTIDNFLQLHVAKRFSRIAKAAIAAALLPKEKPGCTMATDEKDWYSYLLNKVLPADPAAPTNLRIITLNFDRSLDQRISEVMSARYAGQQVRKANIPVLHLHGKLAPQFPGSNSCHEGLSPTAIKTAIEQTADAIHIISEEISKDVVAAALDWIKWADNVCVLGCGFHPFVLERLDFPASTQGKSVFCTHHEMDPGYHSVLANKFRDFIWRDQDILTFLRSEPRFHDWDLG
jgi:hypothetical protein